MKLDPDQIKGLINIDVEGFFAQAIYVESNALSVGRMFNLPDLDGVDRFVQENYPEMRMVG